MGFPPSRPRLGFAIAATMAMAACGAQPAAGPTPGSALTPDAAGNFHLARPGSYAVVVHLGQCTRATLSSAQYGFVDIDREEATVDLSGGGDWRATGAHEDQVTHQLSPCQLSSITMRLLGSIPVGPSPVASSTGQATPLPPLRDSCPAATFGPSLPPLSIGPVAHSFVSPPPMTIDAAKLYEATITLGRGRIVLCLQPRLAPITVNNFVTLARNHFYDGVTFHRVVASFLIQGGDPKGDGTGGPGYAFADEPVRAMYRQGAVGMGNNGPNTNGSQFFICIGNPSKCSELEPRYNLFGVVDQGQAVADAVKPGDVITSLTVAAQS